MFLKEPSSCETDSPLLYLDEIQVDLYKLFSLFYSGIGIIQRDAPAESEEKDTEAILRLENNVKEIIGHFITTKERLLKRVAALEAHPKEKEDLSPLVEETRRLDAILSSKISELKKDLPFFRDHVTQLINEMG
ncbi:hypothetical protein NEDG_01037 [Nematocida displodere]|uniref:Uncharacterized protein n=1 Tax=Nematocida displodere TaxID=1805483 RepID=A0A177EAS8_9MICR|nr:hypothetical protein NEDG_01037 [Nematocida displodere]